MLSLRQLQKPVKNIWNVISWEKNLHRKKSVSYTHLDVYKRQLLIPAMEMSEGLGKLAFLPAVCGFILGMAFLLFLDMVVPHLHMDTDQPEGAKSNWQKSTMPVSYTHLT